MSACIVSQPSFLDHPVLAIGDTVEYRGSWGNEAPVRCTITGKGHKNGRAVYDNSLGHWGYADQYTKLPTQA